MVNRKAQGIVVPMLTPLKEDESVDYNKLEAIVDHIYEGGADGLFQISTTGEYARLSHNERNELAKQTMRYADGRITIYLGVSDVSTKRVIHNMNMLSPLEPDYFVCSPPYYYPASAVNEITSFFVDIAKSSSHPLVLYNIPITCGSSIPIESLKVLIENEKIIGIKDSSGDIEYMRKLLELKKVRPDFAVLSGFESNMMDAARLGCDGYVPSLANVFPRLFSGFMMRVRNFDWAGAEGLFKIIMRMNTLNSYSDSWLSPMTWRKAALSRMGLCEPYMIRPCVYPSENDISIIDSFIYEYSQLKD